MKNAKSKILGKNVNHNNSLIPKMVQKKLSKTLFIILTKEYPREVNMNLIPCPLLHTSDEAETTWHTGLAHVRACLSYTCKRMSVSY